MEQVVELCPSCGNEVKMYWDVREDGYKAYCPYCGERLMLCDECKRSVTDKYGCAVGVCDYSDKNDSCIHNREIPDFTKLRDIELCEFGADVFRKITGVDCKPFQVKPQGWSEIMYWFRVGVIYIAFKKAAKNARLWKIVLTDPGGEDLMSC